MAGGTGFYLRWFIYGKPRTPESTPEGAAAAKHTLDEVLRPAASWGTIQNGFAIVVLIHSLY